MIVLRDRRGRVWARRLDVSAAIRMREIAGLDVMAIATGEGEAIEDVASVVNALYAVMLPDLGRLTPWRFGRRLRAMPAVELRQVLGEAVGEFFAMPGPERKPEAGGRDYTAPELWREVCRMAGAVGVDPGPLTFGELAVMAEGLRRDKWSRNATLRAAIINSNPFRSGSAVNPAELDPTGALKEAGGGSAARELKPENLASFAAMFMRN